MSVSQSETIGFLRRIDLLVLLGALVTLFLALASEPWWTIAGTTTQSLFNIQVSPFYLHIVATGLPSTIAIANSLGSFTRVMIFLGSVALFAASIKPTVWWRNLAIYFGLASIAELYLSFLLIYYWGQTAFVAAYGIAPPIYGTKILQTNMIGLDLRYYTTPLVTAAFTLPCYLGFLGPGLVLGRSTINFLHDRALRLLTALLPGGGISEVYLTPPYQHVWFSSGSREFNPLGTDPGRLNDDELLVSFQKLYQTVEPGGSLSIVLPDWAVTVADRFQKLMPNTGFTLESTEVIYRTPGKPENELVFRKPSSPIDISPPTYEEPTGPSPEANAPINALAEEAVETSAPPVVEDHSEPAWAKPRMTRADRFILKSAISMILEKQEPVQYRELVNRVYMALVDKKIEFDSAKHIETTLLDHDGQELSLIQEPDMKTGNIVRMWWLGEKKLAIKRAHGSLLDRIQAPRIKLPHAHNILKRSAKRGPRKKKTDDDSSSDSYDTSSESPII